MVRAEAVLQPGSSSGLSSGGLAKIWSMLMPNEPALTGQVGGSGKSVVQAAFARRKCRMVWREDRGIEVSGNHQSARGEIA